MWELVVWQGRLVWTCVDGVRREAWLPIRAAGSGRIASWVRWLGAPASVYVTRKGVDGPHEALACADVSDTRN